MSRKQRKRKLPGHYCWVCDRRRPNEKFSGRGHARHVCRECARLGAEELAYRQNLRDLERCLTWEGIIPRKRRKTFERFLHHDDPRIRAYAEEMLKEDLAERAYQRAMREVDEVVLEELQSGFEFAEGVGERDFGTEESDDQRWIEDIPF